LNEYENILSENGVLKKYGKKFENHELVDIPSNTIFNIKLLGSPQKSKSPNSLKNSKASVGGKKNKTQKKKRRICRDKK
jgi:hypothetical protein